MCVFVFVEYACGKTRHSCYYFAKVNVRACVRADLSGPQSPFMDGFQSI